MTVKKKKIVIKKSSSKKDLPKKEIRKNKGHANLIPAKAGEVRNPAGRPKGSRNKFGEAFVADFLKEWEEGGIEALKRVRVYDPATFIRVAASILPKEININEENTTLEKFLEKFETVDEIDAFIRGVTAIGTGESSPEEENKAEARSQSDVLH